MEELKFIKLPESELEVMQAIWALHSEGEQYVTAGLIMKRFPALNRLKLTTVLTLVTRLQMKGFITVEKPGRSNCYTPLIDDTDYKRFITDDFINRVFVGNKAELIEAVHACGGFTAGELAALKALIAKAEGEN